MAPPSWRLKLAQGELHLAELHADFSSYFLAARARVEVETRNEGAPHAVLVYHSDFPPPPMWGPKIGDCVHNLRSALDHLFYAIPRNRSKIRDRDIYFPCWSGWPYRATSVLKGLGPDALEALRRIQTIDPVDFQWRAAVGPRVDEPEFGKKIYLDHPLDILSRLSNTDKHRSLVVGTSGYGDIGWTGGSPLEPIKPRPLTDGDVLAEFAPGDEIQLTSAHFYIMFDDRFPGYAARVTRDLDRIVAFVRERAFRELEPLLS